VLLDTHVLLWWMEASRQLPRLLAQALERELAAGRPFAVADVTLWEIALLVQRDRVRLKRSLAGVLEMIEASPEVRLLPVSARVALEATRLPESFPRDPIDRILAALARSHGLALATLDERIRDSGCVSLL
jgi:PIN domain nuclease of toxin-antitoxin system